MRFRGRRRADPRQNSTARPRRQPFSPHLPFTFIESGKSNVNLAGATDCSQSVFPVVSTRFDKQTVAPRHHITFTGLNSRDPTCPP